MDITPRAYFICCENEFPGQRRCSVKYGASEYCTHRVNPRMVALAEALWGRKADSYSEQVYIPARTRLRFFHDGWKCSSTIDFPAGDGWSPGV